MDADDPRHGTLNGYNTHNRDGEKACDACLAGRSASRKDTLRYKKKPPEARPKWTNYTLDGYDPQDGLEGGRWMRDTWGVVRWVQTEEPKPRQPAGPRAHCLDCDEPVDRRALRCRIHAQIERARVKRDWNRKARAQAAA